MTPTAATRTRACTPRSKTGCATCRRRRIKCDEERPACQRCSYSGWQCPGYSRADQTLGSLHETATTLSRLTVLSGSQSPAVHKGTFSYALPFKLPGGRDERRALHYFSVFAASDMGGVVSSDFWCRTILQRCQHETPLRHATAALGRLHVEYIATEKAAHFSPSEAALQGYGLAVKSLKNYIANFASPSHAVVLRCSAVLFCFELLRGEWDAASAHLKF